MMNYIFGVFIVGGLIYSFITGNTSNVVDGLLKSGDTAISMILKMIPLLCLWLGVMRIASSSGLMKLVAKKISRIIHPIFPELDSDSEAISYIATSIAMNMLGAGNGATPFGLKAFEEMQKENLKKDTATRSMITFLVITTAGVTIVPTTVISLRTLNGSVNPTEILLASVIVTFVSCFFGIVMDKVFYHFWREYD